MIKYLKLIILLIYHDLTMQEIQLFVLSILETILAFCEIGGVKVFDSRDSST